MSNSNSASDSQLTPKHEMTSTSFSEPREGVANLFNPNQVLTIHLPQNPAENLPLISTCFHNMERERDPFQASAYLCSILISFFPAIINDVCEAFTELGLTVTMVTTASERLRCGISMKPPFPVPDSLVLLGQAVLILYKNAQSESYYNCDMEHRISTLRAQSGVPCSTYSDKRISFEKAKTIRSILGSSFGLKKSLLEIMMGSSAGGSRSNVVCSYLCDVLAWSGMEAIVFVYHTLWNPRSPALEDPCLQVEVRNLEEAFDKIMAADHPKYFKILNPPNETKVIEMYRFQDIITLAKVLISNRGRCAYEFQVSPRVSKLKKVHFESVGGPIQLSSTTPPPRKMQYNIEIEGEFVEEVMAYGLPAGLRCFKDIEEYADHLLESMNCYD